MDAVRDQKSHISTHTQFSVHPTAPVLLTKDSRNEISYDKGEGGGRSENSQNMLTFPYIYVTFKDMKKLCTFDSLEMHTIRL